MTQACELKTYARYSERPVLDLPRSEWEVPLVFMLCLSLTGLQFWPALVGVVGCMAWAGRNDRYQLAVMLTIFFGAFGVLPMKLMGVRLSDLCAMTALGCLLVYRKPKSVKLTLFVILAYTSALVALAMLSIESMGIQFFRLRNYLMFIYFIVPMVCFANHSFCMRTFFNRLAPYCYIICGYYIVDGMVLKGNFFLANTFVWDDTVSTFYHPYIHPFWSGIFRKYPPGLFVVTMMVYPMAKYYRMRWWEWALIGGALLASQTFSVILGIGITYVIFSGNFKRVMRYALFAAIGLTALYFIDNSLPKDKHRNTSPMRIASSVNQFVNLFDAVDDEDLALFASGRMAQIIPKYELVKREHRQWIGLGFLHTDKTKITRYVVENDYYGGGRVDELATGVEVVLAQVFLDCGFLGVIAHILFFVALWLIVRRKRFSGYYVSMVLAASIMGMGGFAELYNTNGLLIVALPYAAILLQAKTEAEEKDAEKSAENGVKLLEAGGDA